MLRTFVFRILSPGSLQCCDEVRASSLEALVIQRLLLRRSPGESAREFSTFAKGHCSRTTLLEHSVIVPQSFHRVFWNASGQPNVRTRGRKSHGNRSLRGSYPVAA
jgi:hypothetical protein